MNKHNFLTLLMLLGLVLGAALGEGLYRVYDRHVPDGWLAALDFLGNTVFMGLLKMVLVPLVVSSVIVGVGSISDASQLGRAGALTVTFYLCSMLLAAALGVLLVTTIDPGSSFPVEQRDAAVADFEAGHNGAQKHVTGASGTGLWGAARRVTEEMIPSNVFAAAVDGRLLPLIAFSLFFGVAMAVVGEPARPVLTFFEGVFAVVMRLVDGILYLAPLGVFALLAWTVARIGVEQLTGPIVWYIVTVVLGLFLHGAIVLPLILGIFGRANPFRFLWAMRDALLTAFSTDSSSATLPVTMESAQRYGGCSKRACDFVLPLGATINMDGTALYEAVAVVFMFQCFGIPLSGAELAIVAITATLAAIGAAGIPSAGLVTMVIVVEAVNGSLAALPDAKMLPLSAVGLVIGVDRVLDMCRTTINVWGDAVGAKIITRWLPDA